MSTPVRKPIPAVTFEEPNPDAASIPVAPWATPTALTTAFRAATIADLHVEYPIMAVKTHAGHTYAVNATVTKVKSTNAYTPTQGNAAPVGAPIGLKHAIAVVTEFGTGISATLFTYNDDYQPEVVPAQDTPAGNDAQNSLPKLLIADPHGSIHLPPAPKWGAQLHFTALIPGLDEVTVAERFQAFLNAEFPDTVIRKLQSRSVADLRVTVRQAGNDRDGNPELRVLGLNILEAEALGMGHGQTFVEQIDPDSALG